VADRLAIAAGLVALVLRGIFPLWAAAAILARDLTVLLVGAIALLRSDVRVEVRWIGKLQDLGLSLPSIQAVVRSWEMSPSAPNAMAEQIRCPLPRAVRGPSHGSRR